MSPPPRPAISNKPAMSKPSPRYWAVVPAAGSGSRMRSERPKQYLPLAGRPVLQWSLEALLALPALTAVMVVVAAADSHWSELAIAGDSRVRSCTGGDQRVDSVLAGLRALAAEAAADDWVLVHDAARPCLRQEDLERLIRELSEDTVGGLLAVPVAETIKRSDEQGQVLATVPREQLWLAQTPQMFRFERLLQALEQATADGLVVTDEAAALEHCGARPRLVVGSPSNIKITRPEDLPVAASYLAAETSV